MRQRLGSGLSGNKSPSVDRYLRNDVNVLMAIFLPLSNESAEDLHAERLRVYEHDDWVR